MSHFRPDQPLVSLRELLAGGEFIGASDIRVRQCSADSRTCAPGEVFVALPGSRVDGHDFAHEAVARGAVAVLAQRPLKLSVPVCVVPDVREAYGQLCQALAGNPADKLRLVGITGTNGKSTTTQLVASIFRAARLRTGTLGTLGYDDSLHTAPAELTTPTAPVLAQWLGQMVEQGCSHAVMEVSSHALVERRLAGVQLAHACLTNLRRDHLDYHGTLANYHHAKTQIFEYLGPGGVAIVNADDPASSQHAPLIPGGVLTIGIAKPAEISATLVERYKSEQTFLLTAGQLSVPVRTTMIGDHHIYNCLMATAVGLAEGIDLNTIVRGLENAGQVPGRLERIECGQPFGVFVDYAHTPDALEVVLTTLREVTAGRLICVFGAGGNRDAQKRPLMGQTVQRLADMAVLTTDNPRREDPRVIAADVLAGCSRPADVRFLPDRAAAIRYALSLAGPDDCVLIAGRGHEQWQEIGQEQLPLDDREVARHYLYNIDSGSQFGALVSVSNS